MEKIIKIDGRDVRFKATGSAPLRYKQQFHSDFFADMMKLEKALDKKKNDKNNEVNLDALDLEIFYNISWVFAKTADSSIQPPIEWLDTFDTFPIWEVFGEIQDLLISSLGSSNQTKN